MFHSKLHGKNDERMILLKYLKM